MATNTMATINFYDDDEKFRRYKFNSIDYGTYILVGNKNPTHWLIGNENPTPWLVGCYEIEEEKRTVIDNERIFYLWW